MLKTDGFGPLFEVEMLNVVARSTSRSQNVQSTLRSEHFWKLICSNSVRRCGAKSECSKHHMLAPLLDVEASFVWQAPGILHLSKSEQNVRVL